MATQHALKSVRVKAGALAAGGVTRMFTELAELSGDIIIVADWNRTITYVNPAACEKTGYSRKELVGARFPILYRKENESRYTSKIFKDLYEKGISQGEFELKKKDGSTFRVTRTTVAYHDEEGNPASTLSISKDQTPVHLALQKSMEKDSLLHEVIESMEDAVCVCDEHGRIRLVNNAHCRLIGYKREEILGALPPYPWAEECCEKSATSFRRLQKEGRLKNYFTTFKTKDNAKINVSVSMSYLRVGLKSGGGHVCTIRDVSEVHYADELRQLKEQMQRLLFDVRQKALRLRTLEETNLLALKNATAAQVFKQIVKRVQSLVQYDLAGFYIYDASLKAFIPHTLSKKTAFSRKLGKLPLTLGEGMIGKAAISGKMVFTNNAQLDPRSKYPPGMRPEKEHFIAVPLKGRNSVYGVLVVSRNRDPEFIEEEALVVKSLADAATVALENARLSQEIA
jgi:PAS domain S-box-containing protein